jgi:hypothetical protein
MRLILKFSKIIIKMKAELNRLSFAIFITILSLNISPAQVALPLKASENGHYLVDQNNKPFPILGRTAWFIISQPVDGYKTFISNCISHGYNSIEMHVLDHDPRGNHPPYNGDGDIPFQKCLNGSAWKGSLVYKDAEAPDLTTPNEKYWQFVDSFLSYCESNGIVVFFFPAYLGYDGGEQGWMQELVANGPSKVETYGAWIANRYKHQKNLVWMLLGDMGNFTDQQKNAEAALIKGLKSVQDQQSIFYSAEANSGQNSRDQIDFGNEMTLNGVYSWDKQISVVELGRKAYAQKPVMPAYLLEEPYDEEGPDGNSVNPNATQPVRRFQWWGWLSAIGGYISGNGYVWPFRSPTWQQHLETSGAHDMERLNAFIKSYHWWELIPSGLNEMKTLIISEKNNPHDSDYVAAAATPSGNLLIAYIPPAYTGSIIVDMSAMKDKITARWFDPTSGDYSMIKNSAFTNKGTHEFIPPGKNTSGANDWVLVLESK